MKTDIRKIWDDLIMKSNTDLVEERLADLLDLRCFVGYIGITGKRLFRLALDPALSIEPNYIKQFKGVDIQMIPSTSCNYFTIILLDSDLTDVFVLFIEDLIDSLTNAANELDALNKISVRISYWKRLFAKASGSLLTFEAQRGLFGELFFIQTLLETGSNQKSTISAWKGASGANQDFAFDKSAVEVKTTKGNLPTIQISNEYQLDYREWQNLYMLLVSVTETSTGSKTLFSTINEVRKKLESDPEVMNEFKLKLEAIGVYEDDYDQYDEISYNIRSLKFYHIQEGFPMITTEQLSTESISNVKYQIDLKSCKEFIIPEDQVLSSLD